MPEGLIADKDGWVPLPRFRWYAVRPAYLEDIAPVWRLEQEWVHQHERGKGETEWRPIEYFDELDA